MGILLTQQAADHINRYIEKRGKGLGLRLGVRTTGCSGMAYKLEYVDEPNADDQVFEQRGVRVYIDPKSLPFLEGTQLDYAREGLNEGFKFSNPNEKATCGRSEEHTSELQSLMRISYAVFCLKKKTNHEPVMTN